MTTQLETLLSELEAKSRAATPGPEWIEHDPDVPVYDGSIFACALQVTDQKTGKTNWDIHTIAVTADEDLFSLTWMADGDSGDAFSSWSWEDFSHVISKRAAAANPSTIERLISIIRRQQSVLEEWKDSGEPDFKDALADVERIAGDK